MLYQRVRQRRLGAAMVEMAAVAAVFLLILMGVVEYCRFVFFLQLSENAAREGCRYAVVNTADSNLATDTATVVQNYMNNMGKNMSNFTIQVYGLDSSGNTIAAPQNTPFGSNIVVQIDYDYPTMAPTLMFLNKTIHVTTKAYMCSEAN
jgi:Flp pilus assembly protein TadG